MFIFGNHVYTKSSKTLKAFTYNEVIECVNYMQRYIKSKKNGYFVGYMTYECALLIQAYNIKNISFYSKINTFENSKEPLLYFELFKNKKKHKLNNKKIDNEPLFDIHIDLDKIRYSNDFANIKKNISLGNTYQTNYTQEILLKPKTTFNAFKCFKNLANKQNTKYKAYIKNDYLEILSFSPELFFKIKHNKIITKPMKGTTKRGYKNINITSFSNRDTYNKIKNKQRLFKIDKFKDNLNKKILQNDIKNRSENVMIVDLIRNDLSKVAIQGSVKVKNMFAIHTYPTLHQMTSTIKAKLPKNYILFELLKALFPCGSITGAPKLKTIEIINMLEKRNRGVYCGTIGVVSKKNITFNIPIRTLNKYCNETYYRYGVGSGIVWDSNLDDEFRELKLKYKFLL